MIGYHDNKFCDLKKSYKYDDLNKIVVEFVAENINKKTTLEIEFINKSLTLINI